MLKPEAVSSNSGAVVGSVTFAHTISLANKLVVLVACGDSTLSVRDTFTVTFNSIALTFVGEVDDGNYEHAEVWEIHNPSIGTFNVVVTLTNYAGSNNEIFGAAIGFVGARTRLGVVATNSGTTTNPSVAANSVREDIVVGIVANDNQATPTTENYYLIGEAEDVGADSDFNAQFRAADGNSTTLSWVNATSGATWAALAVAVKPELENPKSLWPFLVAV